MCNLKDADVTIFGYKVTYKRKIPKHDNWEQRSLY